MKLLCFGDSNTFGYDPCSYLGSRYSAQDRWPEILASETGWEVINAGQNGREIPHHSFELDAVLQLISHHQPDRFLVMLGTNDLLQGLDPDAVAVRMEQFVGRILPHCPCVSLVAPPPLKRGSWVLSDTLADDSLRLMDAYRDLAARQGIVFVDTSRLELQLTFDGVHLTEEDHHKLAQEIKNAAVI